MLKIVVPNITTILMHPLTTINPFQETELAHYQKDESSPITSISIGFDPVTLKFYFFLEDDEGSEEIVVERNESLEELFKMICNKLENEGEWI